ncbi:MAG TPA: type II toxin-antitoxin system RelE/ParE family toxin [Tepidisphaeraceae bacterium]|jgi:plasmid stabilization system protein ParE
MARQPRKLTVSLSAAALASLDEIWDWNAQKYNADHADRYVAFLLSAVNKLSDEFFAGKPVPTRPQLSYVTIIRRRNGHGHIAVYELIGDVIHVLDFFHTAQDWQARLEE